MAGEWQTITKTHLNDAAISTSVDDVTARLKQKNDVTSRLEIKTDNIMTNSNDCQVEKKAARFFR